jgi:hypothetical protein
VIAVGPNGFSLDKNGAASVALLNDRLELTVDPSKLQVGQYSGRVVAGFRNLMAPVEVPVTVQVRTGVTWPLLAIIAGVLVGQLARIMREYGDRQATMRLQFNRLLARLRQLPVNVQPAFNYLETTADHAIDQATPDAAATELANFETACQIVETLERYRSHPNFPNANNERDATIINAIRAGEVEAAKSTLGQLRAELISPPTARVQIRAQGPGTVRRTISAAANSIQEMVISAWNFLSNISPDRYSISCC